MSNVGYFTCQIVVFECQAYPNQKLKSEIKMFPFNLGKYLVLKHIN